MIRNDYLLRKQDKQYQQAAQELDQFAQGLLGMDLATLAGMSVQALTALEQRGEIPEHGDHVSALQWLLGKLD